MLKLKYSDLFFYSLVTFALIKIVNIVFTLCGSGMNSSVYHDITQLSLSIFTYATSPLFTLKIFDIIPYRVLQLLHLALFIGFACVYVMISKLFLPLNDSAMGNAVLSCVNVYIVMNVLIEIIERKRVRYYNKLLKRFDVKENKNFV